MTVESPARTRWTGTALLSLLLFVLISFLITIPLERELSLKVSDTLFRVAPTPRAPSKVVLVLIDDESLRIYGRWPWSRTLLAQITTRLKDAGAQAIGIDILLSEPQSPEADAALSRAIRESGAIIVDKIGTYPDGPRWTEPLPEFAHAASAIGHAQAVLDRDGTCRRFPLQELTPDGARLAFAVEVARRADPGRTNAFIRANGGSLNAESVLTIVKPQLIAIPYRRDGFETISAASILRGDDLAKVRSRPVLVGFGPTEISDRVNTPVDRELPAPGVEVHAQILDAILQVRSIRELTLWLSAVLLLLTALLTMTVVRRWHGWKAIACMVIGGVLLYSAAVAAFVYASSITPIGELLLVIIIGPGIAYAADFILIERSVTRQLQELRQWLSSRGISSPVPNDFSWRLQLLRELQAELGSLYELHATLLDTTKDGVGIFHPNGRLFLYNRRFGELFPSAIHALTLTAFERMLAGESSQSHPDLLSGDPSETVVAGESHAVRATKLPPTSLTPEGGTVVTLTSLKVREERDRARAEALGFVTHELRSPLVAIQGFAELMIEYPASPMCAKAPETIFRESKRLLALINSYLDVLRMDAGARPIRMEALDVNAIVQGVIEVLAPLAKAAEIGLSFEVGPPVLMDGDRSLLSGAVLNLVSNAIKYGKPSSTVTLRCVRNGATVVINVHNQGEAIPAEQVARLFEPYYRAPQVESAKHGTGLGLAFVKRIAERHGGRVTVESGPAGTTFEITLPAEQGANAARGAA